MKKVILTVAILTSIISCKKTEEGPCNCGVVQSDKVSDYSVVIQNECSNNNKTFTLTPSDWMNAHVGSRYCITNSSKW